MGLGAKFHDYKKVEILLFSCMVMIVVTYVCILEHSVDRNMHESCKMHRKCLNICSMKYCKENF